MPVSYVAPSSGVYIRQKPHKAFQNQHKTTQVSCSISKAYNNQAKYTIDKQIRRIKFDIISLPKHIQTAKHAWIQFSNHFTRSKTTLNRSKSTTKQTARVDAKQGGRHTFQAIATVTTSHSNWINQALRFLSSGF